MTNPDRRDSRDVDGGIELSALVMLRPTPQSGARESRAETRETDPDVEPDEPGMIQSNDIIGALPDPASVEALRAKFIELGFEVGPAVAISFSISGSDGLFDDVFPSAAPVLGSLESGSLRHASQSEVVLPTNDLRVTASMRGGEHRESGDDSTESPINRSTADHPDDWAGISAIFFPEAPDVGSADH